jgi:hypothetical protein
LAALISGFCLGTILAPEVAQLIEDVTIDSKGRAIPKLYSKLAASKELRAMLNIGKPTAACLLLAVILVPRS